MSRRIPVVSDRGGGRGRGKKKAGISGVRKREGGRKRLTGESRIDPTRLILIRRMKRFPICFIISLLGNYNHHTEKKRKGRRRLVNLQT